MDIETPAVDAVAAVDVIPAVNEEVPAAIAPPTVSDVFPNGDIYLVCGSNYGDRLMYVPWSSPHPPWELCLLSAVTRSACPPRSST